MEYTSTINCIRDVVRSMGTLSVEQLFLFFRNAGDSESVEYYIKQLLSMRIFDYDKVRNWVTYHGAYGMPGIKEETIRRRQMAFWVVAYFGYENIREVTQLKYPSQILFITEDNASYDLTVCTTEMEASQAVRARTIREPADLPDDVNHIAIVRDKELGAKILPYGFDSYCILDPTSKTPSYYTS